MTGPFRSLARNGCGRLGRITRDVGTVSEALQSVKVTDADAASILHTAALRLEAEASHLRTLSEDLK